MSCHNLVMEQLDQDIHHARIAHIPKRHHHHFPRLSVLLATSEGGNIIKGTVVGNHC